MRKILLLFLCFVSLTFANEYARGLIVDGTTSNIPYYQPDPSRGALPTKFSWKDQGKMTPVKNQGTCGSCYAFAAIGMYEAAIKIKLNVEEDLSEQWVVSCLPHKDNDNNPDNDGCAGGSHAVLDHFGDGIPRESNYDYTVINWQSHEVVPSCEPAHQKHYPLYDKKRVYGNSSDIKSAIIEHGPVYAAMQTRNRYSIYDPENLDYYSGGVWNPSFSASEVDHAIIICGWDDSKSAWLVKNTWGENWGENGYVWVHYNAPNMAQYVHFAVPLTTPASPAVKVTELKSAYVTLSWPSIKDVQKYEVELLENGSWVQKNSSVATSYKISGTHGTTKKYRIRSIRKGETKTAASSWTEGVVYLEDYDTDGDVDWTFATSTENALDGWSTSNSYTINNGLLKLKSHSSSQYGGGRYSLSNNLEVHETALSKNSNKLHIVKDCEYFEGTSGNQIVIELVDGRTLYLQDQFQAENNFTVSFEGKEYENFHSVSAENNGTFKHTFDLSAFKPVNVGIKEIRVNENIYFNDPYPIYEHFRGYKSISLERVEPAPNVNFTRTTPSILTTGQKTSIAVGANSGGAVANFQMTVLKYLAPNWSMLSNQYIPNSAQVLSNTYSSRGDYRLEITANGVDGNNQSKKIYDTKVEDPAPVVSFELPTKEIVQKQVSITPVVTANPVVTYEWSWGDGTTSTVSAPVAVSHAFAKPGKYTVTLRAIGPDRETSVSKIIDIYVDMTPINMLLLD